jgi:methionyl-tRNA formyltransferase
MRLVILGDSNSALSLELVTAALRSACVRADADVVAVCDTRRGASPTFREEGRRLIGNLVMRVFGGPPVLQSASRRIRGFPAPRGTSVIVPPDRNVNHPEFVEFVRRALRPSAALCLGCEQILGGELLAALGRPVNCHFSLLPAYRGLRATAWSQYHGETVTGLSYHFMEEQIDTGFVLLQGAIPIPLKAKNHELVQAKTRLAAELMPQVLDLLARGDPGRPPTGAPSYFGALDGRRTTVINDPSALSWEELERRLRAFTVLTISIDGESYEVTRLRRIGSGRPHRPELAFTTLDGVLAEPTHCINLPVWMYRAYRRAHRVRNCD